VSILGLRIKLKTYGYDNDILCLSLIYLFRRNLVLCINYSKQLLLKKLSFTTVKSVLIVSFDIAINDRDKNSCKYLARIIQSFSKLYGSDNDIIEPTYPANQKIKITSNMQLRLHCNNSLPRARAPHGLLGSQRLQPNNLSYTVSSP